MMAIIENIVIQISLEILDSQFVIYYNPPLSIYLAQALPRYQGFARTKISSFIFPFRLSYNVFPSHPPFNPAGG